MTPKSINNQLLMTSRVAQSTYNIILNCVIREIIYRLDMLYYNHRTYPATPLYFVL